MSKHIFCLAGFLPGLLFATAFNNPLVHAQAADKGPPEVQLTTEKLVVYKDGYSLVIKKAVGVTDANGQLYTKDVPDAAVLGSFWAIPKEGQLKNMVAGWETFTTTEEKEFPATQTLEILQANVGRDAKLVLTPELTIAGKIKEVLATPTETAMTPAALHLQLSGAGGQPFQVQPDTRATTGESATITKTTGTHCILTTDAGDTLVPINSVQRIVIEDMKTKIKRQVTTKKRSKRLLFQFDKPGTEREFTLMYFRPGLRWIPTYRVALNEDKAGCQMSLQGELLNEAEDFKDTPVDLVVGVPNFRFRDVVSPMVLETTLLKTLRQAAPQIMGQQGFGNNNYMMSNSLFTQRAGERVRPRGQQGGAGGGDIALPDELTTGKAQDLFVYHVPKMSIKKGERAGIPIFSADDVPYGSIYTWALHLKRSDVETAPSGSGVASPLKLAQNQVWHQIDMSNVTKVPWTTGAAMILQGTLPLAQELLTYTSVGDAVRVPLTVAIDVRGQVRDEEISRDLDALTWDRTAYAKITRKAVLTLTNNKSENVTTEITLRFGGKATAASDKGKITLGTYESSDWENYRGHPAVNNSSTVTWQVTLKPGETIHPEATYHYYTRH